jgi:hypothetical protein
MGYRRKRAEQPIYRLVFADDELAGLEVDCRPAPLGVVQDFTKLAEFVGTRAQELAATAMVLETFGQSLVGWNLEDEDGTPVPATIEGLLAQDTPFVMRIIEAWMVNTIRAGQDDSGPDAVPPSLADAMEPLSQLA